MFDCTTNKYAFLYRRWLDRKDGLLEFAALEPGESVLDLCGGTGVLSHQALEMGAGRVLLWDLNPRCLISSPRFETFQAPAEDLKGNSQFDVVACRQSLGYLNLKEVFPRIAQILRPGGRFVFNTFDHPKWGWHHYSYQDRKYLEASGFFGRRVFHMQWCTGIGADFTMFRWYPIPEILHELARYFPQTTAVQKGSSWKIKCYRL